MKKKILVITIIVALIIGGYISLQLPITKLPTEHALKSIEKDFIKADLKYKEKDRLRFLKKWILGNQKRALEHNRNSRFAGLLVCLLLIVNNLIVLYIDRRSS